MTRSSSVGIYAFKLAKRSGMRQQSAAATPLFTGRDSRPGCLRLKRRRREIFVEPVPQNGKAPSLSRRSIGCEGGRGGIFCKSATPLSDFAGVGVTRLKLSTHCTLSRCNRP